MRIILLPVVASIALIATPALAQTAGNSGGLLGGAATKVTGAANGVGTITRPAATAATRPLPPITKTVDGVEHRVPDAARTVLGQVPAVPTPGHH